MLCVLFFVATQGLNPVLQTLTTVGDPRYFGYIRVLKESDIE